MLSQSEADGLIKIRKLFVDKNALLLNKPTILERQLITNSTSKQERFYLNITQTAIEFGKYSLNTRYFSIPLVRVCIGKDIGHTNPDDTEIIGPHIHFYKEGHIDAYASPISAHKLDDSNLLDLVKGFLKICNIEQIDIIDQKLIK